MKYEHLLESFLHLVSRPAAWKAAVKHSTNSYQGPVYHGCCVIGRGRTDVRNCLTAAVILANIYLFITVKMRWGAFCRN